MRQSSNPVFRSLPQGQQSGYAQFGTGIAGAQQMGYQAQPYGTYPPQTGVSRPLTIDDVVQKTGITLGVLSVVGVISYFLVSANAALAGAVHPGRGVRRPGPGPYRHLRAQAGQPGDRP